MSLEDAADRAAFFDTDDFGVAVTWTRGVTPSTFDAIFDRPSIVVDGADGGALIDRDATLWCREADLPDGAVEGDRVAIAGESIAFACRAIRPDGSGIAIVDLTRA